MDKHCNKCNVKLVVQDNWSTHKQKTSDYTCTPCGNARIYKWSKKNKGKRKTSFQKYYKKNKEVLSSYNKQWVESKKDGNYHVYIINNYAGITAAPDIRLQQHKNKGRDGNTWRVLYSTPYESDALELEALLHDMGYEGRHANALKYT